MLNDLNVAVKPRAAAKAAINIIDIIINIVL
jgi:hypothetical protein